MRRVRSYQAERTRLSVQRRVDGAARLEYGPEPVQIRQRTSTHSARRRVHRVRDEALAHKIEILLNQGSFLLLIKVEQELEVLAPDLITDLASRERVVEVLAAVQKHLTGDRKADGVSREGHAGIVRDDNLQNILRASLSTASL
jgi:hypothetical protein